MRQHIIEKAHKTRKTAEEAVSIARNQLRASTENKKGRMDKIRKAEQLYLGEVEEKRRIEFNVPLPILSGMVDTFLADADDPVFLKFKSQNAISKEVVKKLNAHWQIEKNSLRPDARWDFKDRVGKKSAVMSGRAIYKYFAEKNPYHSILENVDYLNFHCQPEGGGLLEKHLFCGEEGIMRTKRDIENGIIDGIYDSKAAESMFERSVDKNYLDRLETDEANAYDRFRVLGLDPKSNSYVGEETYRLVEWCMNWKGDRWYLLFEPLTNACLRFERLTDIFSSGYFPWTSWATHEDGKVFWSKSFAADEFMPIAESSITLFNQDLTNRQKRNLGARAYDKDMFKNVELLDAAQYRPDALVPADTQGGVKQIANGLYEFRTPEITGTLDVISWLEELSYKNTGINPAPVAQIPKGKGSAVSFAAIQQAVKRMDYRSHSYQECWNEIGLRYIQGLKDNMGKINVPMFGKDGFVLEEIKRLEISRLTDLDVMVTSTKQQNQEDALRKQQKNEVLTALAPDEIMLLNPKWRVEHKLRDIGGWEEEDVREAMTLDDFAGSDVMDKADVAIEMLLQGKEPPEVWDANIMFQTRIFHFAKDHEVALGPEKFQKFLKYVMDHNQISAENTMKLAMKAKQAQQQAQGGQSQPQGQTSKMGVKPQTLAPQAGNVGPQKIQNIAR